MTKATIVVLLSAALTFPGVSSAQTFKVAKYSIGGDGGTDYLTAEPGTSRVFVSRSTHVMVIDGATGKVLGDIPDTPRNHGIALAPKSGHGFITSAGDSTLVILPDPASWRRPARTAAGSESIATSSSISSTEPSAPMVTSRLWPCNLIATSYSS